MEKSLVYMKGSELPHATPFVPLAAHRTGTTKGTAPQGLADALPSNPCPSQFGVHRSLCLGETLIGRADVREERQQRLWAARHRVEAESWQREAEGNHEAANYEKQPDSKSTMAAKDMESVSSTFPFRR